MPREPKFGKELIEEQFRDLSNSLNGEVTVYLIGGGAMTLREQKTATKDIDLVVESAEAYQRVYDTLVEAGYSPQDEGEVSQEYLELGAAAILEKENRRFDIFDRQVAGELVLTDEIRDRSAPASIFSGTGLEVRMFSDADIFLFKSVANRPDDLGDMETLIGGG